MRGSIPRTPRAAAMTATPRRILIVQYSQTGQTAAVCAALSAPLVQAGHDVETLALPAPAPYPFPWPFLQFIDTFPETVAGTARYSEATLAQLAPKHTAYDLIVLAYPVWFLCPAPPMQAFLHSDLAARLLKGTPVITLTTCRNMWTQAQLMMRNALQTLGAQLLDHIVLADPSPSLATFITTPYWVLTGRKTQQPFGLPDAGLHAAQIAACTRFGQAFLPALAHAPLPHTPLLQGLQACAADAGLAASEAVGKRSFKIWAKLLRALGQPGGLIRRLGIGVYVVFLVCLICTVVPTMMALRKLFFTLNPARANALRQQLELPSGNGSERMKDFV